LPERLLTEAGLIKWKTDRVVPDFESVSRFTSGGISRKIRIEVYRTNRMGVARGPQKRRIRAIEAGAARSQTHQGTDIPGQDLIHRLTAVGTATPPDLGKTS